MSASNDGALPPYSLDDPPPEYESNIQSIIIEQGTPTPVRITTEQETPTPASITTEQDTPAPARITTQQHTGTPARIATQQLTPAPARRAKKERGELGCCLALVILMAAAIAVGYYYVTLPANHGSAPSSDQVEGPWVSSSWWYAAADGALARGETVNQGFDWVRYGPNSFITAPARLDCETTEGPNLTMAFALQASTGALLAARHDRGTWEQGHDWHGLGIGLGYPPSAHVTTISGVSTVEVVGVARDGGLWRNVKGADWASFRDDYDKWESIGAGFEGELDFAETGNGVRVAAIKDGTYQFLAFRNRDGLWLDAWENLGRPAPCGGALGSPGFFARTEQIGEMVATCGGRVWHKVRRGAGWDAAWAALELGGGRDDGAGLEHATHGQQLVKAAARPKRLVSRTADHCYYAAAFEFPDGDDDGDPANPLDYANGTWGPWKQLWCPSVLGCAGSDCGYISYPKDADERLLRPVE